MFIEVLSHWCLAAMPAARVLADLTPNFEIVYAPSKDGGPVGYTNEQMRWFYRRGAMAYGRELRADWCEGPQTGTWFANAVGYVGAQATGEPIRVAHAVMSAALEQGLRLGRADECFAFMGRYLGQPASEISRRVNDPSVKQALDEGNRRMAALGLDEKPSFVIESDIGDRVVLKGLWQKELVAAAGLAVLHDERAYRMAGDAPA